MKRLRCHKCGSEDLTVEETCHEHGSFSRIVVNERGELQALDAGYFAPGEIQPQLTRVHCHSCGHDWHPRRRFVGVQPEETR